MEIDGKGPSSRASVRWFDASPRFFATLGVPIIRGRDLAETDDINSPLVGVINETAARRFWPGDDPIGKTLVFARGEERASFQVVGVARDVPSLRPDEPVEPQLYWSNRRLPRPFSYFIVRTAVPPATVAGMIRERLTSVDRDLQAYNLQTLPERMRQQLTTPRFTMLLVASFGVAALFFAAIGTYGLLSYVVSQRTREIGIRLALGAERRQILGSVVRSGLTLAGVGVGTGLVATLLAARALRTLVVGVSVADPLTLAAAALTLVIIAVVACLAPAWRASRVDPVVTLASE
jgi:predicted permease